LMIMYLPIFSGKEPRPVWDFAKVLERILVKGNREPRGVFSTGAQRILR